MKHWRINFTLALIFLFAATLLGRLLFLQIIQHDYYTALAKGQQRVFVNWLGERGEIFLKNYDLPLATTKTSIFVHASPKKIPLEEKEQVAEKVAELLDLKKEYVLEKVKKDNLYELIEDEISEKQFETLKEKNLTGIYFGEEKLRHYPYQNLASHLLGFVNREGKGQYGLEEYWSESLAGKNEFIEGEKGPLGYLFFAPVELSGNQGANLYLTIDYNIQYFAEKLLKKAQDQLKIEGGEIIVIDPKTGKILALAQLPNFDPNQYSKVQDFAVFQNGAIQKIFEPGSVFKPITMAAALDLGKITPQTSYFDQGCLKITGYKVCNYQERIYSGELTMTNVLEKSINTGAVFAEAQLGHQNFLNYLEKFGIFEKTGIDLTGEIFSRNEELKKGYDVNFATASFGQGIEMTPLQIVRAFAVIANGGELVQPYLVEKIKNSDNIITEIQPKIQDNQVISAVTASKLTTMLVSVVENGFAKSAKIPGYYIAGKTGTAQMSFSALGLNKKGYSEKTWQSFIGFAPAFNPQFLALVKLNNPATKTAEYSALPLFQELAKYIIDYYQIPPDYTQ